jgi:hypothetical protein
MNLRLMLLGALALSGCFDVSDLPPAGTSSGGSEGTTTMAADSTGSEASVCPEYCTLMQDLCAADFLQYPSDAVCLAVCEAFPPGNPEDQLGNSSACRHFQAVQANEAPATFCGAAGPTGNGACGAECESFCTLAIELCTGELAQWPDVPTCIADCMQFPADVVYNASVVSGDSYACRTYHLTVAALDPGVHCPHIGLSSPTCL